MRSEAPRGGLPPIPCRDEIGRLLATQPKEANPGLLFDRYLRAWQGDEALVTDKRPPLQEVVDAVARAGQAGTALLKDQHKRLDQIAAQGRQQIFVTTWNLAIGLGGANPLENGFTFDRALGVPYLPGSAIKGLCRAWAALEPESADAAKGIKELLGHRDGSGDLVILPAYPAKWPRLLLDVVNCHHQKYYGSSQREPAIDHEAPVPVYILAVAPETPFVFRMTSRSGAHERLDQAMRWLAQGLDFLGIGAKTAVGYGRARPNS